MYLRALCPHCRRYHAFIWENVIFDRTPENNDKPGAKARYKCPHCGNFWNDARILQPLPVNLDELAVEWVTAIRASRKGDIKPLRDFIELRLGRKWQEVPGED